MLDCTETILLKSFHPDIQDGMDFFKQCHLPECLSDYTETKWEAAQQIRSDQIAFSNSESLAEIQNC